MTLKMVHYFGLQAQILYNLEVSKDFQFDAQTFRNEFFRFVIKVNCRKSTVFIHLAAPFLLYRIYEDITK